VRELRNAVEQIVAFGTDEAPRGNARDHAPHQDAPFKLAKAEVVERFEREYLVSILARHNGNITAAATAADLDRVHFLRLLDRHGLRKARAT
jgi:DNA-binding NtrC family response regulator